MLHHIAKLKRRPETSNASWKDKWLRAKLFEDTPFKPSLLQLAIVFLGKA